MTQLLPEYRCVSCQTVWAYLTIRHLGRCPDCGTGLVKAEARVVHNRSMTSIADRARAQH